MRWLALTPARRATRACLCADRLLRGAQRRDAARLAALPRPGPRAAGAPARRLCACLRLPRHRARPRLPAAGALRRVRVHGDGIETILEPIARGEGVLAFGAHFGSFEALRMIGHDKGLRVAMIMYEDNARLISDDARGDRAQGRAAHDRARPRRRDACDSPVARRRRPRRPARRPHASGPLAAIEVDRPALPGHASDVLRRPVPARRHAAPEGRLHGRRLSRRGTYDLRFIELADFGALPRPRPQRGARRGDPCGARALRRDPRSNVSRGAFQLVQLLRFLGRCRSSARSTAAAP